MDAIAIILMLLVAVVVSGWIARGLPIAVPRPLVQIALGMLIAAVGNVQIELKPEIFFLLFLPPLLFLDAWRVNKGELVRDRDTIVALAVGLVVLTVLGIGVFLDQLIPSMPLAVSFALAAILAPTDAVAVQAITARTPMPSRLMSILSGESLFNDASGLVCMGIAVAAVTTGTFSPVAAVGEFLWVGIGGAAIGIAVTLATSSLKTWIEGRLGEETGSQILISLLVPFAAYLLAELLHCSGILAAVGSGLTMGYVEQSGRASAVTRMQRAAVWDTVYFVTNGVIFILLGAQMQPIVKGAARVVMEAGHRSPAWLLVYVVSATLALALLRFVWAWVSLQVMLRNARRAGFEGGIPSLRLAAATALGGARGAVTMAGVLTLPLTLPDGSPFPARDLAICVAAGVIVLSLVMASIGLPLVLRGVDIPDERSDSEEEERARLLAARAGMKAIERALNAPVDTEADGTLLTDAGRPVIAQYRRRISFGSLHGSDADEFRRMRSAERNLWLEGIRAERSTLYHLARKQRLSQHTARKLVYELDLVETRLSSG